MAERYSRVFTLPTDLYSDGAPVLISAGALLKDNKTGRMIAQLKFCNISSKKVAAVSVVIQAFDPAGRKLGEDTEHTYLDLNLQRDQTGGQKEPVYLPDEMTRLYTVRIREVIFDNQSVWTSDAENWEGMPSKKMCSEIFHNDELTRQYQIRYGEKSLYAFNRYKDLWTCTCGTVNRDTEMSCHACGLSASTLENISVDDLRQEMNERLKLENERRQEEERQAEIRKAEAAKAARKRRKIFVTIAALVLICIAAVPFSQKILIPNVKYMSAVSSMKKGDYDNAISAFKALGDYKDCPEKINECKYGAAVALMDAGDYEAAMKSFGALGNYKDCADKIKECQNLEYTSKLESLKSAEIGSIITFGNYEQDNDTSNGTEKIEWIILAKENERILVMSKYALDARGYNPDVTSHSWSESSLRKWLNNEFFNAAFDSDEQSYIPEVTVSAEKNPLFHTDAGDDTKDQVFLLSITDAKEFYFTSDEERICEVTTYARSQGAPQESGNCQWWLRSPGRYSNYAAYVRENGSINVTGSGINTKKAVRPAMWIEFEH